MAAEGGSTLPLAPDIPLFIAEERLHGWVTVYRGTVASAGSAEDLATPKDAMPVWLLEYLLLGGGAAGRHHQDPVRAAAWRGTASGARQFVSSCSRRRSCPLVPSQVANRACVGFWGGRGWLVSAAGNQTKFSVSRFLRDRKLAVHVSYCFSSLASSVLSGWAALI